MTYEKDATYACAECHKTFKKQRALDAHNKAVHTLVESPPNRRINSDDFERRRDIVCDNDARN